MRFINFGLTVKEIKLCIEISEYKVYLLVIINKIIGLDLDLLLAHVYNTTSLCDLTISKGHIENVICV